MKPDTIPHASALYQAGDVESALAMCTRLIATEPDNSRALLLSGIIASQRGQLPLALDLLQRSVDADPDEPATYKRLAMAWHASGRVEQALATLRTAVDRAPYRADAWNNLAAFLEGTGRPSEARQVQAQFSELAAHRAAVDARLDTAYALLVQGRLQEGWTAFEARLERPDFRSIIGTAVPRWRGEPLAGKSLLVRGEQGHGDHLQFFRYLPRLIGLGAVVSLETYKPLLRLLAANTSARVFAKSPSGAPEGYDYYCPIMSLPLAFATQLETIPAQLPYLAADAALARRWHARLPQRGPLRVGLVWAGGQRLLDPVSNGIDQRRSLHFSSFEPLLDLPGAVFCSLQLDRPSEQAGAAVAAGRLLDWTGELRDFADTAALVDALDLVISADTAVAHLAAAMNKPTWILSRHDGCWRWLEQREDSPWYPSVRLFRQVRPGDWDEVMGRVGAALAALAAAPAADRAHPAAPVAIV